MAPAITKVDGGATSPDCSNSVRTNSVGAVTARSATPAATSAGTRGPPPPE